MRLLRVGEPASTVAADVRAGLTALGRGPAELGGIAVVGVQPLENGPSFDAVLVMPRGIVLVAGIDLPGPALHLEAPLHGQWKADNWPLVGKSAAVNPASASLRAADELASRLAALTNGSVPISLILAVGPFVERVTPAKAENDRVRIVHPRPAALLEAITELVPAEGPACTVEQARAIVRLLDSNAPIQPDDVLMREGFAAGAAALARDGCAPALAEEASTVPMSPPANGQASTVRNGTGDAVPPAAAGASSVTAQKAKAAALAAAAQARQSPSAGTTQQPDSSGTPQAAGKAQQSGTERIRAAFAADDRPADLIPLPLPKQRPAPSGRRSQLRLLPIAAVLVVVAGLVAAIVMATSTSGTGEQPEPANRAEQRAQDITVDGVQFTAVERWDNDTCQDLTYGDVQAKLQQTPCTRIRLASYLATTPGKQAAVSLAVIDFADPAHAKQLKAVADKPGSGGAADAANMSESWPDGKLTFHHAVYHSVVHGNSVRLVRVAWLDRPSTDKDRELDRIAKTAFRVPVE